IQHFTQSDAHDSLSSLYNERAITKCKGCELNNDELLNSYHNPSLQHLSSPMFYTGSGGSVVCWIGRIST
ncbi:17411_t:CDS:2, partial [Funneliformis geosporum]